MRAAGQTLQALLQRRYGAFEELELTRIEWPVHQDYLRAQRCRATSLALTAATKGAMDEGGNGDTLLTLTSHST